MFMNRRMGSCWWEDSLSSAACLCFIIFDIHESWCLFLCLHLSLSPPQNVCTSINICSTQTNKQKKPKTRRFLGYHKDYKNTHYGDLRGREERKWQKEYVKKWWQKTSQIWLMTWICTSRSSKNSSKKTQKKLPFWDAL